MFYSEVNENGYITRSQFTTDPLTPVQQNHRLVEDDSHVLVTDTGADGNINFTIDGTSRWNITSAGHIIPATNANYDIGEAENKVRDLYLSSNSLHIGSDASNTYTLGKDADNDLNWTVNGEANKIATQAYVLANAGGSSSNSLYTVLSTSSFTISSEDIQTYDKFVFYRNSFAGHTLYLPEIDASIAGKEVQIVNITRGSFTIYCTSGQVIWGGAGGATSYSGPAAATSIKLIPVLSPTTFNTGGYTYLWAVYS